LSRDRVRVGLISLGCAKNQVDSECMIAELERAGFELTDDMAVAEAVVVNTCGFIRPAKEESIETILQAARLKQEGNLRVLAVVGCLAQRYLKELKHDLPEVDIFLGVGAEQKDLPVRLRRALGLELKDNADCGPALQARRVETITRGWAYLKISEGCDNRCAYCAIPLIRGGLASRPLQVLIEEARWLESLGTRELNLIAQDVTAWGAERGEHLTGLLERLLAETAIPWIRLLYMHPAHIDERLLEFMAAHPRVLPYIDMPIQHASDRVLAAMGRGVTRARLLDLVARARELLDNPVLRTTVLVGFPGERKRDFEELLEFVAEARFDRLGGFIYSAEEDTRAASLRETVSRAEKERRLEAVLSLQRSISAEIQQERVGQSLEVLVEQPVPPPERPSPEYRWAGRSRAHAPEVDGWVYLSGGRPHPGRIVRARVIESGDYDLFARVERD
jgi:ribosomal protein S12 methylthiotransferase